MSTTVELERREAAASLPERLLVSLVAVGAVPVLFVLRGLDDNRLVSWRFVLEGRSPPALFGLVLAAAAVAHLAVRVRLPAGRTGVHLFLAAALAALPFWRAPEMIVDAARYFTQARHVEALGAGGFVAGWGRVFSAWTDLPLVPFLHGLAFSALGESRAVAQGIATLLFGLTVVVTWRIGKVLFGEEVGAAAGALLLAIPYLLVQAPALLVDVPTMFFVALATWACLEAFRGGGAARVGLAAVAVAAAALSKYSAWVLLTVVPVAGIVVRRPLSLDPSPPLARGRGDEVRALARGRGERQRGGRRVAQTFVVIVLGGAVLLAAALLPVREVVVEQLRLLAGYQAPGLRRWGESFLSTFLFQAHPFLAAGAIASVWLAVRRRDPRWLVAAWPVLVLLLLQVRRARYWIPAFPGLALLAAYGLHVLGSRELRRLAVATAVAVSLVVAAFGYLPFLRRTSLANLQAAGRYLDALPEAEAVVFASGAPGAQVNPAVSVSLLDLHTRKRLVYRDPGAPAPSGVETSALRFTWEHRTPAWYGGEAGARAAVVVVSDDLEAPLPEEAARRVAGMGLAATFAADEGVFAYRTLVRVYRVPPLP